MVRGYFLTLSSSRAAGSRSYYEEDWRALWWSRAQAELNWQTGNYSENFQVIIVWTGRLVTMISAQSCHLRIRKHFLNITIIHRKAGRWWKRKSIKCLWKSLRFISQIEDLYLFLYLAWRPRQSVWVDYIFNQNITRKQTINRSRWSLVEKSLQFSLMMNCILYLCLVVLSA